MDQNKQNDQNSNSRQRGIRASNGQMGKQAGGSPSYESERKDKNKGMARGDLPSSASGRQDTKVARKVGEQQTTLNSSGVQEGAKMEGERADEDQRQSA
jgi:hypothetical protein